MNVTDADNANVTQETFTDSFNRSSASFGSSFSSPKDVSYIHAGAIIVLMVISLVGNVIVCAIMSPKIWRGNSIPLNVLVLSLAVSDVLKIGLEILPQAISYVNLQQWTMGEFACKANAVFRSVFSNVSISTIALISFERRAIIEIIAEERLPLISTEIRFRSMDKPDGAAFSTRSLSVALLLVWVWNTAAASPQAIWFTTVATRAGIQCTIPFTASPVTALYTVLTRVVNFFIPLVISWVCYLGVINKMRISRTKVDHAGTSVQQNNARARVLRRVTITCFLLMTLFTITLAPFQLALVVLQGRIPRFLS
nr:hypothetical protein BaRGS_003513 [Batillaria attramentaria]